MKNDKILVVASEANLKETNQSAPNTVFSEPNLPALPDDPIPKTYISKRAKITIFILSLLFLISVAVVTVSIVLSKKGCCPNEKLLAYNQQDNKYASLMSSLHEDVAFTVSQGVVKQFQSDVITEQIFKFFPQNQSDVYSLEILTERFNASTQKRESLEDRFQISFVVDENNEESISVWVLLDVNHTVNQSQLIKCLVLRTGKISSCLKPKALKANIYVYMLNGLNMYIPFLAKKYYSISLETQNQTKILGRNLLDLEEQDDEEGVIHKNYSAKIKVFNESDNSSNLTVYSDLLQTDFGRRNLIPTSTPTTEIKSMIELDPLTGRVLFGVAEGYFHIEGVANMTEKDRVFLESLKTRFKIVMEFMKSHKVDNQEMSQFHQIFKDLLCEEFKNPLLNYTSLFDINKESSKANGTIENRRMLAQLIAYQSYDVFNFDILGINFKGTVYIEGYLNKLVKIYKIIKIGIIEYRAPVQEVVLHALPSLYKCYSFIKVILLNNILKLIDIIEASQQDILSLVKTFVEISQALFQALKQPLADAAAKLLIEFNELKELLKKFPEGVLDGEFNSDFDPVVIYRTIVDMVKLEVITEFNKYYEKLGMLLNIIKGDINNYKYDLFNLYADKTVLFQRINQIRNEVNALKNQFIAKFELYSALINNWVDGSIEQIKTVIKDFASISTKELNYEEIAEKVAKKIRESLDLNAAKAEIDLIFQYYKGLLEGNSFFDLINTELDNFSDFLNTPKTVTSYFDPSYVSANSLFLNDGKLQEALEFESLLELPKRIYNIFKTQLMNVFEGVDPNFEKNLLTKYKEKYIDLFNELKIVFSDVLYNVLTQQQNNIDKFVFDATALVQKFIDMYEIIVAMFKKLTDPNFQPTAEEYAEMKKINLFDIPKDIETVMNEFKELIATTKENLKLIQVEINKLVPSGSRRLQITTDEINVVDLFKDVKDFVKTSFEQLITGGNALIDQIKSIGVSIGLTNIDLEEFKFENLKLLVLDFIDQNNEEIFDLIKEFIIRKIKEFLDNNGNIILGLKNNLRVCLPPDGENILLQKALLLYLEKRFRLFSFPIIIGSANIDVVLNYEHYVDGTWGYFKDIHEFFIQLVPRIKVQGSLDGNVEVLGVLRGGVYGGINLFDGNLPVRLSLFLILEEERFYTKGWISIILNAYPLSFEVGTYIQHRTIQWKTVCIKIFWKKICIPYPSFSWSERIGNIHKWNTISIQRKIMDKELFEFEQLLLQ